MNEQIYVYKWGNNEKRKSLQGRKCKILQRLLLNSCIVEFENGDKEVISRNALRRDMDKVKFDITKYIGKFIPNDIFCSMTMDGSDTAKWLESEEYKVIKFYDTGRNGLVLLSNGLQISTNGYVCYTKNNK